MAKIRVQQGDTTVEMDTTADRLTRWSATGEVIEQRPLETIERDSIDFPATPAKVRELTDAIDQLILDSLMGF